MMLNSMGKSKAGVMSKERVVVIIVAEGSYQTERD